METFSLQREMLSDTYFLNRTIGKLKLASIVSNFVYIRQIAFLWIFLEKSQEFRDFAKVFCESFDYWGSVVSIRSEDIIETS